MGGAKGADQGVHMPIDVKRHNGTELSRHQLRRRRSEREVNVDGEGDRLAQWVPSCGRVGADRSTSAASGRDR